MATHGMYASTQERSLALNSKMLELLESLVGVSSCKKSISPVQYETHLCGHIYMMRVYLMDYEYVLAVRVHPVMRQSPSLQGTAMQHSHPRHRGRHQ
jgi:hypothetical protein